MHHIIALIALTVAALTAAEDKLTLTGSSTVAPLAAEIAKRFEQLHPGVRVDVQSGGSGRGVADAQSGLANIGLVSRDLKPEEKDHLIAFTIARDGIAVILHRDNSVKALTREQVIAIYTGKTTRWSEVGGKDAVITVVNKAEGRSTLELFCHHFGLKNPDIKAHVVIGDNEQGVKTVAGNPDAIGYVSIGTAEVNREAGVAIKLLPLNGIEANTAHVRDGTWPLARPLNLVSKGQPSGLAKDFITFATSKAVDDLITDLAFVPPPR